MSWKRRLANLVNPATLVALAKRPNLWRILAFDIAAPLAMVAGLVAIGVVLTWPLWWVSVCSVLATLTAVGITANFWLLHRNSVTAGTNDTKPWLRLPAVALCAAALVAAAIVGYTRWTVPDRELKRDTVTVVQIATDMAVAATTFSPLDPSASIDRAVAMMERSKVAGFKDRYAKSIAPLAEHMIAAEAVTVAAGVEAIGPSAASVAVHLRGTQNRTDLSSEHGVIALRVKLVKNDDQWKVSEVGSIRRR